MKAGWEIKTWQDVLEVRSGRNQKEVLNPEGKYPIIGSAGKVMNYADDFLCDEGTTIIGRKGTIDKPQFITTKFWNVDTAFGLVAGEQLDKRFLFYFCSSFDFQKLNKGTTLPSLVKKDLVKIFIPIPPLEEQKQIVAILDQAFAAIDQAQSNIQQNIQNAQELFQSKLNQIFSQQGESWEKKAIGDLTELVTKGSSPKWQGISYVDEPGILFVTSENVGEGNLNMTKRKYLEEKFNEIQKKSILKKGDVLTNIVGASIGRTAIFDLDEVSNINQAVCIMRCKSSELHNYFLMHLLNSPYFKTILHDNEVDNARANLSLTFFKNLVIPLPSLNKQKSVVDEISKLNYQTDLLLNNLENKLSNLVELKLSLLQKAFNGELTQSERAA